jgi:hypothetical protein
MKELRMRRIDWLAACLALGAGIGGAYAAGCVIGNGETDCGAYPGKVACHIGTSSGTGTGGHPSSSSSTGTGGSPPPNCEGPPVAPVTKGKTTTGNILDECAVFVSAASTATNPDGSMASPYKTLADALANTTSSKTKVFACKSTPFSEAVTLMADLEVYGGFDCTTKPAQWTWLATDRTELDGPADKVALTITAAADGALVSGLTIKGGAPSATLSSIAVAVDDMPTTGVTIQQSDISAAAGSVGVLGTPATGTPSNGVSAAVAGGTGGPSDACVVPAAVGGGLAGSTMCSGTDTSGASGGKGGINMTGTDGGAVDNSGQPGGNGNPLPNPNPTMAGVGGTGQTSTAACHQGQDGLAGGTGNPGSAGVGPIMLSLSGLSGGTGGPGAAGTPGQGGGGGGGAMSGTFCVVGGTAFEGPGASGGGGGAGGCAGLGGGGGGLGGSSIAILSLGTKLTVDVTSVTLTTATAGDGGKGAAGQSGGQPGNGAAGGASSGTAPSTAGCKGGDGGTGGFGGSGGGGLGGFSAGIAFAKTPTAKYSFTMPPSIGDGGAVGGTSTKGPSGAICDFSKSTPTCTSM